MTNPAITLPIPPMISQMALLVGDPVKNLEKSELNEFELWLPKTNKTIPTTTKAIPRGFIIKSKCGYSARISSNDAPAKKVPAKFLRKP